MADEAQSLVIVTERMERCRRRDSCEDEGPEPALMMLGRSSGRPERLNRSGGACSRSVPKRVTGSANGCRNLVEKRWWGHYAVGTLDPDLQGPLDWAEGSNMILMVE